MNNQIQKENNNMTSFTVGSKYNLVSNTENEEMDVDVRETSDCSRLQIEKEPFRSSNNNKNKQLLVIIIRILLTILMVVVASSYLFVSLHSSNTSKESEDYYSENEDDVELLHNITTNSSSLTTSSSTGGSSSSKASLSPWIIVTEGGCSASTAVGGYLNALVMAHDLDVMEMVGFEFLHKNKNPRKNQWKNPFYHNISVEAQASNLNVTEDEMMIKSIKQANKIARKQNKAMIFKANTKQYQKYHNHIKKLNPMYFGVYRQDSLRRCICMVKDCFHGVRHDGYPIFVENGTQTDLCFGRRFQPNVHLQVMLTNVTHCVGVSTEAHSFLKTQSFPSLPEEELFLFEYSNSHADLMTSVRSWNRILKSNLKGSGISVSEAKIQKVLESRQNSRSPPESYKKSIRNYDEIEKSLIEMGILNP